ncbi:hypothetical protein [Azospirillum soli]|uniref:hypothetical protein n=1 Tax=Azospirillum soli TaxID=1304799 RepID=UPI001AE8F527|nr:hypothetical protein [Azospirillum soli]
MIENDRRLGDRILSALELALEQENLEVSEHLAKALEETLTRFGGAGVEDHRDLSENLLLALDRLDRLRRRELAR